MASRALPAVLVAAVGALAACTSAADPAAPSPSASSPAAPVAAVAAAVASPPPEPTLAWGPTEAMMHDALARAAALPLEDAAGQVVVAAVGSPDPAAAADLVARHGLGGVILMGEAITDADGVKALTAAVSAADDRERPVWISVDEEGGLVSRLREVITPMPSFMAAGAATDKAVVERVYASQAAQIRDLGIGIDFAPVADMTVGPSDPIIRTRSAGDRAEDVAATVAAAVAGFADAAVVPVLKHFPGHGSVTADSHRELPVQEASVAELAARDLIPFARAIDAGAPAVMVAHIAVPEWGDEPATLQPEAYAYLREELGFTGVAVTDALNMGAIVNHHGPGEAAALALAAGADVLLMPASVDDAVAGIVAAVQEGGLSRERLDQAVARMTLMLEWSAGVEPEAVPLADPAYALGVAGTTLATADCDAPLVTEAATVVAAAPRPRAALEDALRKRGIDVGDDGPRIVLMGSGRDAVTADVVVSTGAPFGLERSDADAYIATYGSTDASMRALADVLTGAAAPGGTWPVAMPGMPFPACA
ncbi:glycoside hydrolase family 3 N-terminal domain-containing protein [Demequina sp. SYSU T00068]|uniref:glycoside hydrolase family 3 N-terminal domain-containing protein n=1 Tax=Demequina lignilytica TaxID=3051663 RepID=UPI00261DB470|nr:glycoside hydrolase family 3 N-terminal domain-containing protein [Demequina sp. SYSU T00068]MDN4490055.1 glycoside hydrolase family 3 N-terminal domain-containing protein [Demequina sp. SYSU T00068]